VRKIQFICIKSVKLYAAVLLYIEVYNALLLIFLRVKKYKII